MRWWPGALAATMAIRLSASAASAVEIAYSQGVLNFDESRRLTVGAGGDFSSCADAFAAIPKDGLGGIIEFLPGNHVTSCGNLGNRGDILLTATLGPNGERPVITTPTRVLANGVVKHEPFVKFISNAPDNFVIENLEINNTGGAINVWDYGGMVMRNVKIDDTNGADAVKVYPTYNFQIDGYRWDSWLEVYDSEVSRGGSSMNRPHSLDQSGLEFSDYAQGDGLAAPPDFMNAIGVLLPIAPCGRSSL